MSASYFDNADLFVDSRIPPAQRLNTQEAFAEINNVNSEKAAKQILAQMEGIDTQDPDSFERLDPTRVAVLTDGISEVRAGDTVDVLGIMFVAGIGAVAGTLSHKVWDLSPSDVPVNGVIGAIVAGGAALTVMKKAPLAVRGAVAAAGGAFLAGSTMWVRMKPEVSGNSISRESIIFPSTNPRKKR